MVIILHLEVKIEKEELFFESSDMNDEEEDKTCTAARKEQSNAFHDATQDVVACGTCSCFLLKLCIRVHVVPQPLMHVRPMQG